MLLVWLRGQRRQPNFLDKKVSINACMRLNEFSRKILPNEKKESENKTICEKV